MMSSYLNKIGSDGFFVCQYTKQKIRFGDHILLPAVVPQVAGNYVCHPDAQLAYRKQKKLFHEIDRNCNACKHVLRIAHERIGEGFTKVGCAVGYFEEKIIHPNDFMGLDCWEPRL